MSEIIERYRNLTTPMVSDALWKVGTKAGTMDPGIKPVYPGAKLVGPAFTVKTYPGATHGTELALQQAQPGDVIVVDGEGYPGSILWGGIMSATAKSKGLAGIVIDGAARDTDDIRKMRFPVFARHVMPRAGTFAQLAEVQIAVTCGGAVVNPGDLVMGDDIGVVVVPKGRESEVLEVAEQIREKEDRRMVELLGEGWDEEGD